MTNVPTISFVAKSGTGKTTLIEALIKELKNRGYKIGALKHDAHTFDIDHPGKDSYRMTAAGADTTIIASNNKLAMVKKLTALPSVEDIVCAYFSEMDLVVTEGFRNSSLPKIQIVRKDVTEDKTFLDFEANRIIAIAADFPLEHRLPVLNLNDVASIADFILARFQLQRTVVTPMDMLR